MTLVATVAPLSAYAVTFQTLVYLLLPLHPRTRWAPVVTGMVGAALTMGAGLFFGFERIGIGATDPAVVGGWALATFIITSAIAAAIATRPGLRHLLADPRMAQMSNRESLGQILVRIPIMTALIEEAFFRGLLHAALTALWPTEVALWVGAGLFGLWHVGPGFDHAQATQGSGQAKALHTGITVLATTLAGAFFVWLRIMTGSIWVPVVVHAGINMTMAAFARWQSTRVWAHGRRN